MDTRAAQTAKRSYQGVETVAAVNRPKSPEGKAVVSGNSWKGSHWLVIKQAVKEFNMALREQQNWLGQ